MSGDAFVAEDGARVLNRRANIEVLAGGIVRGDEIETAVVLVVDSGGIHEAARAGGLEGLGKLADQERSEISRQGDDFLVLKKANGLRLAALVGGEKRLLVLRNGLTP